MIFAGMLAMGMLLGFCGAGGSGMTIALLVAGYGVSMHEAVAVAITAMIFTMISGTISHLREGEVEVRMGLIIGGAGMVGAFFGAHLASSLATKELGFFTSMMMLLSAVVMYIRLYRREWLDRYMHIRETQPKGRELLMLGSLTGVVMGFLSGAFGIGATAFIQLSLMMFFGVSLLKTIGTCMLIILPISVAGSFGYILNGHLNMAVFVQTFLGLVIGSFIGAKFTSLAPRPVLQAVVTVTPFVGGLIIFLYR
ncbi:MAG: sulfite exporter TauE/SafE family protein [Schwartzia sp.]|nr:sulfite exporter TauE/SafE family protein [Schwartzia sp. (in: firmicutes)]